MRTTPCSCCGHVLAVSLKPNTPDTSSDDATLAAAEAFANSWAESAEDAEHIVSVVAIARRLQGEVAAHARCHRDTAGHIDKLESEVRELRATIARALDLATATSDDTVWCNDDGCWVSAPRVAEALRCNCGQYPAHELRCDATTGDKT